METIAEFRLPYRPGLNLKSVQRSIIQQVQELMQRNGIRLPEGAVFKLSNDKEDKTILVSVVER